MDILPHTYCPPSPTDHTLNPGSLDVVTSCYNYNVHTNIPSIQSSLKLHLPHNTPSLSLLAQVSLPPRDTVQQNLGCTTPTQKPSIPGSSHTFPGCITETTTPPTTNNLEVTTAKVRVYNFYTQTQPTQNYDFNNLL